MAHHGMHVGVVGVGRIGAFHARTLASSPSLGRLTLVDDDGERAADLARELGAETEETPEALVDRGVEALVIATSTPAHVPLVSLAATAGIPAFCEKPVALHLDVIDRVAEEVDRAGILVQVGFQRRFDAGYLAARDAVASDALGRLLLLRAATHDPVPPAGEYIAASGGIFRDLHIHDFDAIHFVTGQEVAEVYADGAVRETPWFADYGDVDAAAATRSATTFGSRSSARGTASRSASTRARRCAPSSPERPTPPRTATATSSTASRARTAPSWKPSLQPSDAAVRAPARWQMRAPRWPSRSRPAAHGASGGPSRSRRWLAQKQLRAENRTDESTEGGDGTR